MKLAVQQVGGPLLARDAAPWTCLCRVWGLGRITRHRLGWGVERRGRCGEGGGHCGAPVGGLGAWSPMAGRPPSHRGRGISQVAARTFVCPSPRAAATHARHTSSCSARRSGRLTRPAALVPQQCCHDMPFAPQLRGFQARRRGRAPALLSYTYHKHHASLLHPAPRISLDPPSTKIPQN